MKEARRGPCSGGKAGAEERCGSAKRTGMHKTELETALDVRYSELKRDSRKSRGHGNNSKLLGPKIVRMSQPEIRIIEQRS